MMGNTECGKVRRSLTAYEDGELAVGVRQEVAHHLESCDSCQQQRESADEGRGALSGLRQRAVPAGLGMKLKVVASHERERALRRRGLKARWQALREKLSLWGANLMEPLAIPATGGLASSILLFTILTPLPAFRSVATAGDIPLPTQASEARLRYIPPVPYDGDITVDVLVDNQGKVMDFQVVEGSAAIRSQIVLRQFESAVMLMEFRPATQFGQSIWTTVRIVFRSNSEVEIRG